jgi:hypothetical protein
LLFNIVDKSHAAAIAASANALISH